MQPDKVEDEFLATVQGFNKLAAHQGWTINDDPFFVSMNEKPRHVDTISSGSLVLDQLLGGGFGVGRVVELYGVESSGKTSIALTAAANVQRQGGHVFYFDAEQALDFRYARVLGVQDDLQVAQVNMAESIFRAIQRLCNAGIADLIVVDSVAALMTEQEQGKEIGDTTVGTVARAMSNGLRRIIPICAKSKTTVIFINQLRQKIGVMYGNPETTTGGNALKYYCSQRVRFGRGKRKMDGDTPVGTFLQMKVEKNKVAPPFKSGTTLLSFDHGLDRAQELFAVAKEIGGFTVEGRTYTFDGKKFATSAAQAEEKLRTDRKLFDAVFAKTSQIYSDQLFTQGRDTMTLSDENDGDDFRPMSDDVETVPAT